MTLYLLYFLLILIVPIFCSVAFKKTHEVQSKTLKVLMFLMYLILALKADTVGSDIAGYKEVYELTGFIAFNDFSYSYMENGYLFLMKLFSILGFSFQGFAAIIYAMIIIPLYYLIKKYSQDVMISVMVLFCLDFFVFACSGLRQVVAMSLCVWAFLLLKRKGDKRGFIFSIIIVVLASFIHKSAVLFIPVLFILYFNYITATCIIYIVVLSILLLNSHLLINLNQEYEMSKYEFDERLTLGLMFVFDVIMLVFYIISISINQSHIKFSRDDKLLFWQFGNIVAYGLILMVGFNGSILLRSAAYELLFLSILMPMSFKFWNNKTRQVLRFIYIIVLFVCLYFFILEPNALRIVPYKFFF